MIPAVWFLVCAACLQLAFGLGALHMQGRRAPWAWSALLSLVLALFCAAYGRPYP